MRTLSPTINSSDLDNRLSGLCCAERLGTWLGVFGRGIVAAEVDRTELLAETERAEWRAGSLALMASANALSEASVSNDKT